MLRSLGAVRLSNLTDETTSPQRQRADITTDPVVVMGELVDWAEDLDVSADKFSPFQRPKLGPWLTDPDKISQYDALVFAKADRAVRSMMDMYELSKWGLEHRKVIVFVKGPGGGPRMELDFRRGPLDPITQLIIMIFAFAGEIEVNLIKERTADSQKLARQENRWHGGYAPFGYKVAKHSSGKGFILVPDDYAVKVLRQIADLCREKHSLNSICTKLNEDGILTTLDRHRALKGEPPKGLKWSRQSLKSMLLSKTLLGIEEYEGKVVYDDNGLPIQRAEPAISRSDWDDIQAHLSSILKGSYARTRTTSPLLGILFCALCGATMYRAVASAGRRGREYYRCKNRVASQELCSGRYVSADAIYRIIEERLLAHIGDLEILEEVYVAGESHEAELEDAKAALNDLLQMSEGKSEAVKAVYDARIETVEARIVTLSGLPQRAPGRSYRPTGVTYRAAWETSDSSQRREMLLKAGLRVEAAVADAGVVSLGRFERPTSDYEALSMGVYDTIQYAFFVPTNLTERATRQRPPVALP